MQPILVAIATALLLATAAVKSGAAPFPPVSHAVSEQVETAPLNKK
jgi:hypothetical protein